MTLLDKVKHIVKHGTEPDAGTRDTSIHTDTADSTIAPGSRRHSVTEVTPTNNPIVPGSDLTAGVLHYNEDGTMSRTAILPTPTPGTSSAADTHGASDLTAGVLHANPDGSLSRTEELPTPTVGTSSADGLHGQGDLTAGVLHANPDGSYSRTTDLPTATPGTSSEAYTQETAGTEETRDEILPVEGAVTADRGFEAAPPSTGASLGTATLTSVVGGETGSYGVTAAGYSGSDVHIGQFKGEILPGPAGITGAYREGEPEYERTMAEIRDHGVTDEDMVGVAAEPL